MLCSYTQIIKPTKEQKEKIENIFTPDYVIESSKVISIMIEQDSVIKSRDKTIEFLEKKIQNLNTEHKKTLVDIAKQNNIAKNTSKKIDTINDNLLKLEKLKWSGIHFYAGVEVPKINFSNIEFNGELMYEMRKIHFGIKGQIEPSYIENHENYNFTYFLKLRYKLF